MNCFHEYLFQSFAIGLHLINILAFPYDYIICRMYSMFRDTYTAQISYDVRFSGIQDVSARDWSWVLTCSSGSKYLN